MPTAAAPGASQRPPIWIGLLILYVVWGSTYLAVAYATDTIPPFLMMGMRFLIAGTVLLTWSLARDRSSLKLPTRRELRDSAIVGSFLLGGGMGLVSFGEHQTVPSGITALLIATMPVWVAILSRLLFAERLPRLAVAGIVIGFGGVAFLIGPTALGGSGALDALGLAAILVSPILWVIGSLYATHRARLPKRPLFATGLQMVSGGLLLVAMSIASGELGGFHFDAVSGTSWAALAYLAGVGSVVAFTAYGWLLRVAPLPLIATYAYVNPIVAVGLGAIVRGEPVDPRTLVAGGVIVFAVALIVTARSRMTAPRPADTTEAAVTAATPGGVPAPTL